MICAFFLPAGTDPVALPILTAMALRAFADGCVAVVLPAYLLALGLTAWEVGLVATATLLGLACGALLAGVPEWVAGHTDIDQLAALRGVFLGYGLIGGVTWWLYRRLPEAAASPDSTTAQTPATALGVSRRP